MSTKSMLAQEGTGEPMQATKETTQQWVVAHKQDYAVKQGYASQQPNQAARPRK